MKYLLVLLLALLGLALALRLADSRCEIVERTGQPRTPTYSWSEMSDIFARQEELQEEQKRIQLYHKNQRVILSRLSEERLSLRDAAAALDVQARDNHPHMHDMLGDRFPGVTSVERMALRLLEQLKADGCPLEVIERLSYEMTSWSEAAPALSGNQGD